MRVYVVHKEEPEEDQEAVVPHTVLAWPTDDGVTAVAYVSSVPPGAVPRIPVQRDEKRTLRRQNR